MRILPKGNTQRDVNRAVLEIISSNAANREKLSILDAPCGVGDFICYLQEIYPEWDYYGVDIVPNNQLAAKINYSSADLSVQKTHPDNKFDIILSISGVMMFGNTQYFLENCCNMLTKNGTIIITNDNCFTVRDRISYLIFGKFRRFKLLFDNNDGMTQFIPLQELVRILRVNGLSIKEIKYTSLYPEDYLFLPFALLIFPLQYFSVCKSKADMPISLKKMMFPFWSLLCRHYILVASK